MSPHIPQNLDSIGNEIGDWLRGGDNTKLDEWYSKYGKEFIDK